MSPESRGVPARQRVDIRTSRGLALVLPIVAGDRVLVVGEGLGALALGLRRTGAWPTVITPAAEESDPQDLDVQVWEPGTAFPSGPMDHVIVASERKAWVEHVLVHLQTFLTPGGSALVALPSRRAPHLRTAQLRSMVGLEGLEVTHLYGIRQSLTDVRHLVPLDARVPLLWYARRGFLPTGRRGELVMRLATMLRSAALTRQAFGAFAVVARRSPSC